MTPHAVAGLLAEPVRLRVFSAVVLGAASVPQVLDAAGVPHEGGGRGPAAAHGRRAGRAVGGCPARPERPAQGDRPGGRGSARRAEDHGSGDARVESVLRAFLRGGRLIRLPAQCERRRLVLRHLTLRSFEPGVRYPERAVDGKFREWCEGAEGADHVAVRRHLVVHGLLTREGGVYRLRGDLPAAG